MAAGGKPTRSRRGELSIRTGNRQT